MRPPDLPAGARGHDPETLAVRYLGGELDAAARAEAEAHLLACEACWTEVALGREGRSLAESTREVAPPGLRDRLRAVVVDAAAAVPAGVPARAPGTAPRRTRRPRGRARVLLAAAALLVAAGVGVGAVLRDARPAQDAVVTAAARDVSAGRLPGDGVPTLPAPDLGDLSMAPVGGASGSLGGVDVTGYTYRDGTGRELVVYVSDTSFPRPADARDLAGPDGPWLAVSEGLAVLCARAPHDLLVLGDDPQLVRAAAEALDVA